MQVCFVLEQLVAKFLDVDPTENIVYGCLRLSRKSCVWATGRHDAVFSGVTLTPLSSVPCIECAVCAAASLLLDFAGVNGANEVRAMFEPAAPSEGTPASTAVALSSLARRPFKERLCVPKVSSQERAVMSMSLARQTTASALTEIFWFAGNPKLR